MVTVTHSCALLPQLVESFPDMSRTRLKQFLQRGRILVNGAAVTRHDHPLRPGDTIDIAPMRLASPGRRWSSRFLSIVYEDRHLIVIDKAAGILSMATSHHSFCVKDVLDSYLERTHQPCHAHLVHRLDRDTSGLMVYAKSRQVQQLFESDWKGLVYDRRYVCVVRGAMPRQQDTVKSWLSDSRQYFTVSSPLIVSQGGQAASSPVSGSVGDGNGKLAITHYRVLQQGERNSLVEARLDTGRKNQIRVHFSALGNPVLGDRKYGPHDDGDVRVDGSGERLYLHAYRLHFVHPVTGEDLHFDTPVPQDFLNVL